MVAVTPAGMVVKFTGLVWKTFQWQRDWTEPPIRPGNNPAPRNIGEPGLAPAFFALKGL